MNTWIVVLPAIVIGLGTTQLRTISATGNESTPGNEDGNEQHEQHSFSRADLTIDLITAWIEKPPYTTSPTNESLDNGAHGMIRDVLLPHIIKCNYVDFFISFRADSEFHMIELLRKNKVHTAGPIFKSTNRRYDEFLFIKIADYPGSEFITGESETNKLSLVLNAVLKSWSLFAVTLIPTAIAGIIMWALVCLTLCT